MITAEQAYAYTVLGEKFRKSLDKGVKQAASKGELFFKVPLNNFPDKRMTDEILQAISLLGYQFRQIEDGASVVVDFSFGWLNTEEASS